MPDARRRVRGVQPGDVGAQLADLGDQGLSLSHSSSISGLTPMSTTPAGSTHEATSEGDNSQHQASDDQGADTAADPSPWSDVTKDPYLSCARP